MIPERGPQTVFKQFLRGAINVLQSIECNLCCATYFLHICNFCNFSILHILQFLQFCIFCNFSIFAILHILQFCIFFIFCIFAILIFFAILTFCIFCIFVFFFWNFVFLQFCTFFIFCIFAYFAILHISPNMRSIMGFLPLCKRIAKVFPPPPELPKGLLLSIPMAAQVFL